MPAKARSGRPSLAALDRAARADLRAAGRALLLAAGSPRPLDGMAIWRIGLLAKTVGNAVYLVEEGNVAGALRQRPEWATATEPEPAVEAPSAAERQQASLWEDAA